MLSFDQNQKATSHRISIGAALPPLFENASSKPVNDVELHRKTDCACGGGCPACQAKSVLNISHPNDPAEIEADQMADRIMRMSIDDAKPTSDLSNGSNSIHRKCGTCEDDDEPTAETPIMRKEAFASTVSTPPTDTPASIKSVIASGGRPLDPQTRNFFEPRFGVDLSHVRVFTDSAAWRSAKSIDARAYTLGGSMVFGQGEYQPQSESGKRLIAHELAHVGQQQAKAGVLYRAEVDDRSCAGLTDIETDVDAEVNTQLAGARTAVGSPIPIVPFLKAVKTRLGDGPVTPIEKFIEGMAATKRKLPSNSLTGTKYEGVGSVNNFYHLQTLGLAHVVGSAAKVHGICIGADKLGHFFSEGLTYLAIKSTTGKTQADAEAGGRWLEIDLQGLFSTGVFSNADRAANLSGLKFYEDLMATPTMTFAVSSYITDQWNEQKNPSFYEASVGNVVWANLIKGNWTGNFTSGGGPLGAGTGAPVAISVQLTTTSTGNVTGTYQWPAGAAKPAQTGTILNGKITQNTTSVSGDFPGKSPNSATPVSGIKIEFDWAEGSSKGKGVWTSLDEQTLDGTWGIGSASSGAGLWKMTKV